MSNSNSFDIEKYFRLLVNAIDLRLYLWMNVKFIPFYFLFKQIREYNIIDNVIQTHKKQV